MEELECDRATLPGLGGVTASNAPVTTGTSVPAVPTSPDSSLSSCAPSFWSYSPGLQLMRHCLWVLLKISTKNFILFWGLWYFPTPMFCLVLKLGKEKKRTRENIDPPASDSLYIFFLSLLCFPPLQSHHRNVFCDREESKSISRGYGSSLGQSAGLETCDIQGVISVVMYHFFLWF